MVVSLGQELLFCAAGRTHLWELRLEAEAAASPSGSREEPFSVRVFCSMSEANSHFLLGLF